MVNDLELYILRMDAGAILDSKPHSPGSEEYLTVLEGSLEVRAGAHTESLGPEDCVIYAADVPHSIKAVGSTPARAHLTVRFTQKGSRR
jgi:quercetin dioxygenase-like cupin family protein